jgi:hypothetical protein
MPTYDRQRQRNRTTNAAFRKKPNHQRGYKQRRYYNATRSQPDARQVPLRERPSLWINPERDDGGSRRDGLWLAP